MLIACAACRRQYDVGDFAPGSRVRCACGELNVVPRVRARQVAMLHCSNCGGALRSGATECEYCSAEVRLGERGLGPACPECLAATLADARHCGACGVRIAPEAVLRALSDRSCPRCREPLAECVAEGARYVECTGCGGLWLDEELFERVARERDGAVATAIRGAPPAPGLARGSLEKDVRYLPCPVCGELMNRRNFAGSSGVVLDWCRGHGWWFDPAELERALTFVASGGLERARAAEHERRMSELRRERERREPAPTVPPAPWPRRTLAERLVELLVELW